jgi:glyoxylase-like metal-dependent hydrolase (beta-lactamase superfamily II)
MSVFDRFMGDVSSYFAKIRADGAKRYPADPLVEVFQLRENVYSILAKSPGMGGDPWMHLVIGPERAMLIDTAYGIGDLKGLVETLTDKPYFVVNTHFHGDHSMGNYQFDKVYCHKYDVPYLIQQFDPHARDRFVPTTGAYYKAEDLVPIKEYEVIGVEDGYVFDLGQGYEIELVHLPGHAPGGCGFLDPQTRILFSGDAIVSTPTMCSGSAKGNPNEAFMSVTAFRDQLLRLEQKMDRFDVLFPGHAILDYPAKAVTDMLQACNEIIADPEDYTDMDETMPGRGMAKLKVVGYASIAYSDDRI